MKRRNLFAGFGFLGVGRASAPKDFVQQCLEGIKTGILPERLPSKAYLKSKGFVFVPLPKKGGAYVFFGPEKGLTKDWSIMIEIDTETIRLSVRVIKKLEEVEHTFSATRTWDKV